MRKEKKIFVDFIYEVIFFQDGKKAADKEKMRCNERLFKRKKRSKVKEAKIFVS